jgi:hypothetical protein
MKLINFLRRTRLAIRMPGGINESVTTEGEQHASEARLLDLPKAAQKKVPKQITNSGGSLSNSAYAVLMPIVSRRPESL